jgi:hypothetical protein
MPAHNCTLCCPCSNSEVVSSQLKPQQQKKKQICVNHTREHIGQVRLPSQQGENKQEEERCETLGRRKETFASP